MACFCCGCWGGAAPDANEVVVYTALDKIYSEPILLEFEKQTGIKVKAVYDVESMKTVGLKNRIIAEQNAPNCDVFWSNEVLTTMQLHQLGLLQPHLSLSASDIPEQYKDPQGFWTGFAARARVIVYNPDLVQENDAPHNLEDFADPKFKGMKLGIAKPIFGTTYTHFCVLYAMWGEERFLAFLDGLKANGVQILDGNAVCMKSVAAGTLAAAFTDSDDANLGKSEGKRLEQIMHDQDRDGAMLIPNSLSMIKGCRNPDAAAKLIDYLLSAEVELTLSKSESAQIPLRSGTDVQPPVIDVGKIKLLKCDFEKAAKSMDHVADLLKERFLKN